SAGITCPMLLSPQQYTSPCESAHVCWNPDTMLDTTKGLSTLVVRYAGETPAPAPCTRAMSVSVPTELPSVHEATLARPAESVVALAGATTPPPVTSKVNCTPDFGFPYLSTATITG